MSEKGFRVEIPVQIRRDRQARKVLAEREAPKIEDSVPRIARLLALAHKWEGMVRRGETGSYAEIAGVTSLSRARVTQICSLSLLPPNVQEHLLQRESLESPRTLGYKSTPAVVW